MSDLVERLIIDAACLRKMMAQADIAGPQTGVRVKSPGLLLDSIVDAIARIKALETELAGLKLYAGDKSNQYVAAIEENKALRKALEDILAPIAAATRDLEPGQRLSGMAYTILTSAENLRDIARSALAEKGGGEE